MSKVSPSPLDSPPFKRRHSRHSNAAETRVRFALTMNRCNQATLIATAEYPRRRIAQSRSVSTARSVYLFRHIVSTLAAPGPVTRFFVNIPFNQPRASSYTTSDI